MRPVWMVMVRVWMVMTVRVWMVGTGRTERTLAWRVRSEVAWWMRLSKVRGLEGHWSCGERPSKLW